MRVSNDSGTAFQVLKRATTFRSTARAARIAPSVHRWLFNLSLNTCDDGYLNSLSAWWPGGSGRTERVALDSIWSSRSNVASVETPCNYLSIHHLLQMIPDVTFPSIAIMIFMSILDARPDNGSIFRRFMLLVRHSTTV